MLQVYRRWSDLEQLVKDLRAAGHGPVPHPGLAAALGLLPRKVSRGLQRQSLWRIPTAAVG